MTLSERGPAPRGNAHDALLGHYGETPVTTLMEGNCMVGELLSDVLLSSDPEGENEWSAKTLRACDVRAVPEGHTHWQVRVNRDLVGPGTVGWIHRWREGGCLAGVIVFTGCPEPEQEPRGVVFYAPGELRHLRPEVVTDAIRSHAAWSNKAPYTTNRAVQFRDGTRLTDEEVSVLESVLSDADRFWLAQARRLVAAGRPADALRVGAV